MGSMARAALRWGPTDVDHGLRHRVFSTSACTSATRLRARPAITRAAAPTPAITPRSTPPSSVQTFGASAINAAAAGSSPGSRARAASSTPAPNPAGQAAPSNVTSGDRLVAIALMEKVILEQKLNIASEKADIFVLQKSIGHARTSRNVQAAAIVPAAAFTAWSFRRGVKNESFGWFVAGGTVGTAGTIIATMGASMSNAKLLELEPQLEADLKKVEEKEKLIADAEKRLEALKKLK